MFLNFVSINFQGFDDNFKEFSKTDVKEYKFKKSLFDVVVSTNSAGIFSY